MPKRSAVKMKQKQQLSYAPAALNARIAAIVQGHYPSVQAAAEDLGIVYPRLLNVCANRNRRGPSLDLVIRVAKTCSIDVDYILFGAER